MDNYSIAYFCLIISPRDTHHILINNRKSLHVFFNTLASSVFILFNLDWRIILMHIQQAWWVTRKWNQKANLKVKTEAFSQRFYR